MTVVAEGVATEAQRKMLADLGCDVAQGFLHAPALLHSVQNIKDVQSRRRERTRRRASDLTRKHCVYRAGVGTWRRDGLCFRPPTF
nr:EAL domain-containing protein [Bradyrhizobium sp. CCBAU 11386]